MRVGDFVYIPFNGCFGTITAKYNSLMSAHLDNVVNDPVDWFIQQEYPYKEADMELPWVLVACIPYGSVLVRADTITDRFSN